MDFESCKDQLEELIEFEKKNGYVSLEYIKQVFVDLSDDDLDEIYDYLDEHNINVTRDESEEIVADEVDFDSSLEGESLNDEIADLDDKEPTEDELLSEEEADIKLSDFDMSDNSHYQTYDTIGMYLHDIGMYPLLDREQENQLAKQVQNGIMAKEKLEACEKNGKKLSEKEENDLNRKIREGKAAHDTLVESNLRLVVSIARKYSNRGLLLDDLIQEGNFGLMKAVDKFDYTLGYKFSTYATWWIRQGIVRAIADKGRNVRIPVHMHESINRLSRIRRRLVQELHREPTTEELAKEMKCPPEKIVELQRVALDSISFDNTVGDEDESTLIDLVPDENTPNPLEYTVKLAYIQEVDEILQTLTPREEMVIRYRYGIGVDHCYTLEEIGKQMVITRERVRQIEAKAIDRLRSHQRYDRLKKHR